jgi:hypothetical protein
VKSGGSGGTLKEPTGVVSTERLMRDIERTVRADRRTRLVARGGAAEFQDEGIFAEVEAVLRRAIEQRDRDVLLLPDLLADEDDWLLQTRLRFSSHRPVIGPLIVFAKRRLLLPVMRWLYEYSLENFRRQQRVNRLLFVCLEELAIENAKLRRDLTELRDGHSAGGRAAGGRRDDAPDGSR